MNQMDKKFIKAVRDNNVKLVKILLQDDSVNPATEDNEAIRLASIYGYTEIVKLLLQDDRVNPADNNNAAIGAAASLGRIDTVKLLLEHPKVNPAGDHNYAIRHAAEYGRTDVVKLLLQDPRVNPADENNHAIKWAVTKNYPEIVMLLLKDPRVDWRVVRDYPLIKMLLRQQTKDLKKQYITSYLAIQNNTTRTLDLDSDHKMTKSLLDPSIIKKISYDAIYDELCSNIPVNINVPPMKLIALANALKIDYNFKNIKWVELCAKVKTKIYMDIFH